MASSDIAIENDDCDIPIPENPNLEDQDVLVISTKEEYKASTRKRKTELQLTSDISQIQNLESKYHHYLLQLILSASI